MLLQRFIEKNADGDLQGLILKAVCTHCGNSTITPLIRTEAASGKKHIICQSCKGKNLVKFSPSNVMSEREKIVERELVNIPPAKRKDILVSLAWVESLYLAEGYEKIATSHWEELQVDINYWRHQYQIIDDDKSPNAEFWNILVCFVASTCLFILASKKNTFNLSNSLDCALFGISFLVFMWISFGVLVYWALYENKKRDMGINILILIAMIFIATILFAIFFNDSNIASGGFTLILVVVTAYYASITNKITEKQWKNDKEPIVIVYLKENETDIHIIDLIIENVGKGIAKNVKFVIHPLGFVTLSGDSLEKLFFFQNGIQALPIRQKYLFHLINLHDRIYDIKSKYKLEDPHEWREKLKEELELKFYITYQDIDNEPKKSEYLLNPCMFWGLRYPIPQTRAFTL
jgi:DNA-directed RNA polymerase subunit RPC12/RpoP